MIRPLAFALALFAGAASAETLPPGRVTTVDGDTPRLAANPRMEGRRSPLVSAPEAMRLRICAMTCAVRPEARACVSAVIGSSVWVTHPVQFG